MEKLKEQVGRYAAKYVESGMIVGLGTGSTAKWFVDEIGRRLASGELTDIIGVSTSSVTTEQARDLGIPMLPLDEVNHIDVLVDGADESTMMLEGIKGGGGALLHEKITAEHSHKIIWVVDESKVVETLGKFPLPVEVIQFGAWKLFRKFAAAGLNPTFRKKDKDSLFITDSGNYIIDLHLEQIPSPHQLAFDLKNTVGVVEHGLFLHYAEVLLVAKADGTIQVIEKAQQPQHPGM